MKSSMLAVFLILCSLLSGALGNMGIIYLSGQHPEIFSFLDSPQEIKEVKNEYPSTAGSKNTNQLRSLQESITHTANITAKSVVSIVISKDLVVYRSDPWGFFQQPTGTINRQVGGGSGFFIKKDGTILTNKHVVSDPNAQYTVILSDGTEYAAKVLATDPVNDLALIKIDVAENVILSPLHVLKQSQSPEIGSFAIAVGNALAEFQNSVSLGIVSGKDRSIEASGESLSGLIQTDAAINPGNSGGPLLDLDGNVIGINTAIVSGSNGLGFAIALSQEKIDYMLKSIAESGRIKRPFIGINYIANSAGVAQKLGLKTESGAYIIDEAESIVPGSSAQTAGLEPGDIILEVNNTTIVGQHTLESVMQNTLPGEILSLKVLKKSGEEKMLSLTVGEY